MKHGTRESQFAACRSGAIILRGPSLWQVREQAGGNMHS
jgi:hypothetical protein